MGAGAQRATHANVPSFPRALASSPEPKRKTPPRPCPCSLAAASSDESLGEARIPWRPERVDSLRVPVAIMRPGGCTWGRAWHRRLMSVAGKLEGFKVSPPFSGGLRSARAGGHDELTSGRGRQWPPGLVERRGHAAARPYSQHPAWALCLALLRGQWARAPVRFLSISWLVPAPDLFFYPVTLLLRLPVQGRIRPPEFCCFARRLEKGR